MKYLGMLMGCLLAACGSEDMDKRIASANAITLDIEQLQSYNTCVQNSKSESIASFCSKGH